jgi:diguanylate cyclase (GGDEF)-like protein
MSGLIQALAKLLPRDVGTWPPLRHWSLRQRVILAFVAVAAMSGLCGIVGIVFVNRITTTVSTFVDVTSPLLIESIGLVGDSQRMRSTFYAGIERNEDASHLLEKSGSIHQEIQAHIEKLRSLAVKTGVDLNLDAVKRHEDAFHMVVEATIKTSVQAQAAAAAVQARRHDFAAADRAIQKMLHSLIDRAEGRMFKAEDEAKVEMQTGVATVESLGDRLSSLLNGTYPLVQNAGNLLRTLDQVEEWVQQSATVGADQFGELEQNFRRAFHQVTLISGKLAGRLRDAEGVRTMAALQTALAEAQRVLLGPDGLLGGQHAEAAAREDIAKGLRSFEEVERAYLGVIDNVEAAVRALNQRAKGKVAAEIDEGRTLTSAAILFTIVAAVLFSLFFAHRLTAPLASLAAQVGNIRSTGELKALPDACVARRGDEIGALSRSFNLMIGDLARARAQLIAQSEAEISKQYERLSLAINNMPQGLCMFDSNQKLIICNDRYQQMYELPLELTAPGTSLRKILEFREASSVGPAFAENYVEDRLRAIASSKPWDFVHELRDGRTIAITHVPLPSGGLISTHEDVTERRKAEAKITYMAHHDMLTNLANRVSFREEMQKEIATLREAPMAVLCLDLDYFKNVNDTLGHPVGDALLKAVADRLRLCLRPSDTVARLGGDEFAIVQSGVAQPGGATALASRLIREIGEPFMIEDHQVVIGTSVGISLAPNDGRDPDLLMKNADMALYRAKEDGRGTFRFFEPNMDARMQARRNLELDLRKALALGQFDLFYQPQVNIKTGKVSTCEALLRWHHPERGLIAPAEFIPLAEEIGFINQLGSWVLSRSCADARQWPDHVHLSVNLSAVQFKSGSLVSDVVAALDASGLAAHRLELEITESVMLIETDSTLATLNQLRELGVHISMDDFGTGYSSLGYLRKFPFDKIKIDQSFIRDLADKPDSIAIIRAVAGLANTLGITTTAEGVETEAELRQIRAEGCTEAQGFLFSRPVTAEALLQLLERRSLDVHAAA